MSRSHETAAYGPYLRYFPVETSIERAKMTAYHAKVFSVRRVADVSLTRERADGTYYAYFPFALTTEAAQMRPYHAKERKKKKKYRTLLQNIS